MVFLAISFHVLSTVGYWACWALDLWWITEVLDLVYRGPKKWASTTISPTSTAQLTLPPTFLFSSTLTFSFKPLTHPHFVLQTYDDRRIVVHNDSET
jgi:hypothetical protein